MHFAVSLGALCHQTNHKWCLYSYAWYLFALLFFVVCTSCCIGLVMISPYNPSLFSSKERRNLALPMSLFGVLLILCHLEIPDREELLRLVDEAKAKITGQWGSKLFYLCHFFMRCLWSMSECCGKHSASLGWIVARLTALFNHLFCSPCSPFVKGECIHGIGKGEFGLNYMPACASERFYAKNSHAPGHNVLYLYRKYWSWAWRISKGDVKMGQIGKQF